MLAAKGLPSHNYLDDILAGQETAGAAAKPSPKRRQRAMEAGNAAVTNLDRRHRFGRCQSAAHRAAPAVSAPAMVQGVGIDQNLNAQIPLELKFKDETGQTVRLGQYFRGKPVVLALVYYECPGLCNMVLNGLTHSMEQISLERGHGLRSGHRQLRSRTRPGSWPPRKKPTTSKSINGRAPKKAGIF